MRSNNYKQPAFRIILFENNDVVTTSTGGASDNVFGALGEWGDTWKGSEVQ